MLWAPDDGLSSREHITQLRCDGVYAGEDTILASKKIYRREAFVYNAGADPFIYKPRSASVLYEPIKIAFLSQDTTKRLSPISSF